MATAASPLQIDPVTGLPIDPATGQPIQQSQPNPLAATPQADAAPGSIYGSPQNATIPGINPNPEAPMQNRYTQNQDLINAQGTQINNEATYQMGYYGQKIPQYVGQEEQQLAQLAGQPGYTPGQQGQINVDYSQFNTSPEALAAQQGNPQAGVQASSTGQANEGAQLNAYGQNLSGEVGNYQTGVMGAAGANATGVGGAADKYGTGVTGAVTGLKTGLEGAQNFDTLNSAVNDKSLGFDPNSTEKQLSDADVQNMKTAAGTRIGNQYRTAEDTLERQAAEAGNTSPLAMAAARARLQTQEASDQGDAELNADIAAKQAQFGRAQGIENQRLGASQTQQGMRATAGTTEEAAAQAAAGLAGTAGISAAEDVGKAGLSAAENIGGTNLAAAGQAGQAGINAANAYGTKAIDTQTKMTDQDVAAKQAADAAEAARALQANQQAYQQGTGSAQLTSGGAQTVGNADIAGKAAARAGTANLAGFAQTGGNQAATQQNTAYGTQTSGLNSSAASQGNFINGKPSLGDTAAATAVKTGFGLLGAAKGDIVNEPQIRKIGERGPEMVIPLGGRYRKNMEVAA